ncbi:MULTISPECIES: hypothetical protein [Dyella]|uniref:Uncharacterized protein n=2 Tax=Dyella TaxID=231454 RepID=A0A4R0YWV4_9GAMM|nr:MULTISPECIES: hypothetical protein [Dyella]TBR39361.1 hypothetical protein EYV96_03820 [Dyella terrae]TCI13051.1 hypothetical protein EZM97_07045 [Dyella soli]
MSTPDKHDIDEREWAAQERAMRAPRHTAPSDEMEASYRWVARAAASQPLSGPPADFAASMAAAIVGTESRFERLLSRCLFLVFLLVAGVVTLVALKLAGDAMSASGDLRWMVAGAGCIAVTWGYKQLRELAFLSRASAPQH